MERKAYKQYSREFKIEALRLAAVGDKPVTQIARELGIRVNQLCKWKQQLFTEEITRAPAQRGRPADGELEHLRRDNAKLRQENEILKKAAVLFSRGNLNEASVH